MALKHRIDVLRCKGCGLCIYVCPKKTLELSEKVNKKGYTPVLQVRPDDCVKCTACCLMCPEVAITIEKEAEETTD